MIPKFQLYEILQDKDLHGFSLYYVVIPDKETSLEFYVKVTSANSDQFLQYKPIIISNIFCLSESRGENL